MIGQTCEEPADNPGQNSNPFTCSLEGGCTYPGCGPTESSESESAPGSLSEEQNEMLGRLIGDVVANVLGGAVDNLPSEPSDSGASSEEESSDDEESSDEDNDDFRDIQIMSLLRAHHKLIKMVSRRWQ